MYDTERELVDKNISVTIDTIFNKLYPHIETNSDRKGHDFSNIVVNSTDECRKACSDNSRCLAWTHFHEFCFLKDDIPEKIKATGISSGISSMRNFKCI